VALAAEPQSFGKEMGTLDSFLSGTPGYFRTGEEAAFPWSATSGVWYALLVVEDGRIVRYGFTAAKGQKTNLRAALEQLAGAEATLLGVWTGSHRTDLFVLDIPKAITNL
jgi:hypothetical protein